LEVTPLFSAPSFFRRLNGSFVGQQRRREDQDDQQNTEKAHDDHRAEIAELCWSATRCPWRNMLGSFPSWRRPRQTLMLTIMRMKIMFTPSMTATTAQAGMKAGVSITSRSSRASSR
jgi:hypothetical protein